MAVVKRQAYEHQQLLTEFWRRFGAEPAHCGFAPGRVNLIGGHTDYNDGFVLPLAIDKGCSFAVLKRSDACVKLFSLGFSRELLSFDLQDLLLAPSAYWQIYARAAMQALVEYCGEAVCGADMLIVSDLPVNVGLSSSSAFMLAVLGGLAKVSGIKLDGLDAAQLVKLAENKYVGRSCGVMDPLSSTLAKRDKAMLLDCRSLQRSYCSLPEDMAIVVIDSGVVRSEIGAAYHQRRNQCQAAAAVLGVHSLREASLELLERGRAQLSLAQWRRAHHAISENARVLALYAALQDSDLAQLSALMRESHQSMRDMLEVSCAELDVLVNLIEKFAGNSGGAGLAGAGFGGCVIALLPKQSLNRFDDEVIRVYFELTAQKASYWRCEAVDGMYS
ncbi:galactokinase [Agaribacterium haliotis]|uniref:galactokinase n=1 Tax=Agaribacterium haliotis TaxID=2013869 RepID=UPI001303F718|nr:galactokinase [Agaribacterium haliotis]